MHGFYTTYSEWGNYFAKKYAGNNNFFYKGYGINLVLFLETKNMIQEIFNEASNPREINNDLDLEPKEPEEIDEVDGYNILPSNGPGLTGDDGEQVIDEDFEEEDGDDDEE